MTVKDNKSPKPAPAKKPATPSLADLQKQIAALQAQAIEIAAAELKVQKDKFQKMEFSGLADLPEEFIVEFLCKIQSQLNLPENRRIIINSIGVFIKDNVAVKDKGNSGNSDISAKPMMHILDNGGKAVDYIMDRGPISEKLYNFAKLLPDYSTISYLEFRKLQIKKSVLCKRLGEAFPSKFLYVGKED